MYTLELADGSSIIHLKRKKNNNFQLVGTNSSEIYFLLSDDNLAFATLYKNGIMEEVFIDYKRQSFSCDNGIIEFRIAPIEDIKQTEQHKKDKEQQKKRDKHLLLQVEKEMEAKGW